MEYLVKITSEQKEENFWKYDFVDLKTGGENSFYHSKKLNYISIYAGRLKLFWNEEQKVKFWQSFEQDLNSYVEGSQIEKALAKTFNKSNQVVEELESEKIKLSRQKIIEWEAQGLTQKGIAELTGYCERTIRYRKNPTNKPEKKRGRPRKMNEGIRASLYLNFLADNAKTQQARANSIYLEKGIKVSQQVISYNLKKDIGFTRKKGAKRYSKLDMVEVRQFLSESAWLYSSPYCLAEDEFHTHLGEAPRYAWSREGCSVDVIQTGQKIATYTVIIYVRNVEKQAVISYKMIRNEKKKIKDEKTGKDKIKKGTNALDFYNSLKNIELPPTNEKYYLLLDNSRIHKTTKELRELGLSIEELAIQRNIIPVYLPKNAPQINPVELCNNFIKGHIREGQPQIEEDLRKIIEKAIDILNQEEDLTKWFRHCRDFFFVCGNGK